MRFWHIRDLGRLNILKLLPVSKCDTRDDSAQKITCLIFLMIAAFALLLDTII